MRNRLISDDLETSLLQGDEFIYYHLIKFEKPKPAGRDGATSGRATDYTYITDAPFNYVWDDDSVDSEGASNGPQTYHANKVKSIGSVQETTNARASTMSLNLSALALGTTTSQYASVTNTYIDFSVDMSELGFREGDKVHLAQELYGGVWASGDPYSVGAVIKNGDQYFVCTSSHTSSAANEPGVGGSWSSQWDYSNHNKYIRIDKFGNASGSDIPNSRLYITPIDTGMAVDANPWPYNFTNVSEEINALTFAKSGEGTLYSNYINREVFIYRAHANPRTGEVIGDPFLLFKGIIAQGSVQENPGRETSITWSLSSHWGDFVRVQGRLTSDDAHRALALNGRSDPEALIRPEYESDYGFIHSDRAVNALGIYQAEELRYKTVKRGGLAGFLGGKKVVEYYETVDREVDLRFNLSAKYLPVVYGVQKVSSIPIFADLAEEEASKLFVLYAMCEGPIGAVYDIHVDEVPSVCTDLADWTVREPYHVGATARNEDSNVDVLCYGRSDRGDVLAGEKYFDSSTRLDISWIDYTGPDYSFRSVDGANFAFEIFDPREGQVHNQPSKSGLVHETTYTFDTPIDATFVIHAGLPDQRADNTWVNRAAKSPNGAGFKIQKDYFDGDPSNYWGPSHQLLDTAYIAAQFTLSEGEATLPQYDFVVRGKSIECYNYDDSFAHNPLYPAESESNFELGDLVDVQVHDPIDGWETAHSNVAIIDKWFVVDDKGEEQWRFRVDVELINLAIGGGFATEVRLKPTGTSGPYWHMVTYDHAEDSGNVVASPIVQVTNGSYVDNGGLGQLTVTLANDGLDNILTAGEGYAIISFTTAPKYFFKVENYDVGTNTITLSPHSGAGAVVESQNFGGGDVYCYVANFVEVGSTSIVPGDLLKITRFTDGVPEVRTKTVEYVDNNYLFTADPFNRSLIPGIDEHDWVITSTPDLYEVGSGNDKRVSINPAMQLLDYLTNRRYGKGLALHKDLVLESFRESARLCDDKSKITLIIDDSQSVNVGDKLEHRFTDSSLAFQGTVTSVTPRLYNSNTYYEVVLDNCIGKLGRKWNDWEEFKQGEFVWGFNRVIQAASTGTIDKNDMQTSFTDLVTTPGYLTLTNLSGGDLDVRLDRFGGVKNSNSIIRSWNPGEEAFSSPGYTLYDSDDVKYWKYLGWDSPSQRWVTRHQMNQVVQTSNPIFDNINSMLRQFNGIMRYSNGVYELDIKTAAPPESDPYWVEGVTLISEADIVGNIKLDDKGMKESYNSISANIVDPQNKFDARSISFFNSEYLKEDKGISKQGNFAMPGISNYYNARTNIIQYLDESRYGLSVSFVMDPKGYMLLAGNTIRLSYKKFGWENKLFRIDTLTFQNNGLVSIVAKEHNDAAYLIDYSDRNVAELENPPVPIAPVNLAPPVNFQATEDQAGVIVLSWENSPTYNIDNQRIQVWALEASKDVDSEYIIPYESEGQENSLILDVTDGTQYYHDNLGSGVKAYFYWIRYVQYRDGKPAKYSPFTPLADNEGLLGTSIGDDASDGLTVLFQPESVIIQGTSLGEPASAGPYLNTSASFEVLRGGENLTPVSSTPGQGQFSVSILEEDGIDAGSPSQIGNLFQFGNMSNFVGQTLNPERAVVKYRLNVENVHIVETYRTIAHLVLEGSDAWQIGGTNMSHTFIADGEGEVINNDFSEIIILNKVDTEYTYDGTSPPPPETYRLGTPSFSAGVADVFIDDGNGGNTGEITISNSSTIFNAGGPETAQISIPIIDNSNGITIGYAKIALNKVFSGARGGSEFTIEAPTGAITSTHVTDWVENNPISGATATAVATEVIALAPDGYIRPNDRITIASPTSEEATTRVYNGSASKSPGSVLPAQFSSQVVEIFDGSVIVDGTLSAEKLAANTAFVNDLYIGSNLIVGSAAAGGGVYGKIYSHQKAGFGDTTAGFYFDHDGNVDISSLNNESYLRYDASEDRVELKGRLVVTSSNSHLVTWDAGGTCSLDEYNQKVFTSSNGFNGWVRSNTAYGKGASAICEPADTTHRFIYGLSDTPNDTNFTGSDIEYGWDLQSGTAYPTNGTTRIGSVSQSYGGGDLLQVYNDGETIRWFINNTEVHTQTGQATGRVYSWKGVFDTAAVDPGGATTGIEFRLGAATNTPSGGADGADGQNARSLSLTSSTQAVTYNSQGTTPDPASITITAEAYGVTGQPYYEFVGLGQNGISNTFDYTPPASFAGMPETVVVRLREGGSMNPVVAEDQITFYGVKKTLENISISISNQAHTLPTTSQDIVDYTGSGTDIEVYLGAEKLDYDDSAPYSTPSFRVSASGDNIDPGTPSTVGTETRRYGDASNMTTDSAQIDFVITITDDEGVEHTRPVVQSLAKARQGAAGQGSETVSLLASQYVINYGSDNSETDTIDFTTTVANVAIPYYEFFVDNVSKQASSTTSTFTLADVDEPGPSSNVTIRVEVREGAAGPIVAEDSLSVYGVKDGSNAVQVFLDNPAHTFAANSTGTVDTYASSGTAVFIYEGDELLNYDGVGTSPGTFTVSASGTNITPGSPSQAGGSAPYHALYADTSSMSANQAYIIFTVTGKRKDGGDIEIELHQSFSKARRGDDGYSAQVVKLNATEYVVIYNGDGSNPGIPDITLTAEGQGIDTPWYKFETTGSGFTNDTNFSSTASKTWSAPASFFSTPEQIRVGVSDGDQNELSYDTISIHATRPGIDAESALAVILSNEAHTVPRTAGGSQNFDASGTDVTVYEGATLLEFIPSGTPSAGQWEIVNIVASNAVAGSVSDQGLFARVDDLSNMTGDIGYLDFHIEGKFTNGADFDIVKRQSLSRATDGSEGATGAAGADGADGADGIKTSLITIFRRNNSTSAPAGPNGDTTFTFSTGAWTGNVNGWSTSEPDITSGDYLWVRTAVASGSGNSDVIAKGEWSGAVLRGKEPVQKALIELFRRTSGDTPDLIDNNVTYTFETGALSGSLDGWTENVPTSGGGTLWRTFATAIAAAHETTGIISSSKWAAARIVAENGEDGPQGPQGPQGPTGATGATGTDGDWGAGMYSITSNDVTTGPSKITGAKINGAIGRTYAIKGDVCIVVASNGSTSDAYKYTGVSGTNNSGDWDPAEAFIDGDLVVDGGIDARELRISNLTSGGGTGMFFDGANNRIDVYDSGNLRVRLGNI